MNPNYSILLCNQILTEYHYKITEWLNKGIKVIWFGREDDCKTLKEDYKAFVKEMLLLTYTVNFSESAVIIDGIDPENFLTKLEKECPAFNMAQYKVEHCHPNAHIVVQASAGTGKTKVMIDRILYLMHTVSDLELSEIYMITFTNDAANQMNQRLQEALMTRYHLTGDMRYFRWVEQQSQMGINTIHSFAYAMLKEYGIEESFTKNLTISDYKTEREELISKMIDEKVSQADSVRHQSGLPLYKAKALVGKYWNQFESLGISHQEIKEMNWGEPLNKEAEAFQRLMISAVSELDDNYFELKRNQDAIGVNDIMRDLQEVMLSESLPQPDLSMKYLFIDEFQDSDLAQIKVAVQFVKQMSAKLFVVGDVKQSIYRFRGATEYSFDILERDLKALGEHKISNFVLVNNYRTAANIMNEMNRYFAVWGKQGILKYDGPVVPFHQAEGEFKMLDGYDDQAWELELAIDEAEDQLEILAEKIRKAGKSATEKDRVVMLTRSNYQLNTLANILKFRKIPAEIKRDGTFFTSEAVRDFYALICSYMFADEPKHIFNFLMTPFAGEIDSIDVNLMEQFNGEQAHMIDYLSHFLKQTCWEDYYKRLRLYPVMSIIREIIEDEPIVDNYIRNSKQRKAELGWKENRILASTTAEGKQYQANLHKLLVLLRQNLDEDKVSLYDVYKYLKYQIATNRSESEPELGQKDSHESVLCMTVHKSKGLEFETVIVPFTHNQFPSRQGNEIIIDPLTKEVGWNYQLNSFNNKMRNDLYAKLKAEDVLRIRAEETRILYVAMTRAINNLICIVHPPKDKDRWSYLLKEAEAMKDE